MDDTQHNQREQRVETQNNADTPPVPPPAAPAESHGASAPHTLVEGTQHTGQQSGGRGAGVNVEHLDAHGPVYLMSPSSPPDDHNRHATVGRIHGNPPTLSAAFTGREDTLRDLHAVLHTNNAALTPPGTPVPRNGTPPRAALQGLGGMGKTQTALAYLYRHQHDYADLFWAIGETPEQLASQLAAFAPTLDPPVPVLADQNANLQQVKQWFATHDNWLLVVDNAENLPQLKAVLPPLNRGRLLLTTRDVAMSGLAKRLELDRLDEDNGALLLLRRADPAKTDVLLTAFTSQQQEDARAIRRDVDGLPLALDQAGAYIEAKQITPARYRQLYQQRRETLHHGYDNPDHASVAVTFDLALKQVEQVPTYGKAAAQLVRLCAFLAPDAIPDEIFTADASKLNEPLASLMNETGGFEEVYATACRYALLRHDAEPSTFTMHRLAQEVVRDSLTEDAKQTMQRQVVRAVSAAFPNVDYPAWPLCERLLPHALLCYAYVATHDLRTRKAALLLNRTATYLQERARYVEAEPLFVEALTIYRAMQGVQHPSIATLLNNLGKLYWEQGRYAEAEPLYEEALAIQKKALPQYHPDTAQSLHNLAELYWSQGRYADARKLYEWTLPILLEAHGLQHPNVAISLSCLGYISSITHDYTGAESLLQEALAIDRATISEAHPDFGSHLMRLGRLYLQWGRTEKAVPLLTEALSICKRAYGMQHPAVAICYFWQGRMYYAQGNLASATVVFRHAWEIQAHMLGPNHPDTVSTRNWLAKVEAG